MGWWHPIPFDPFGHNSPCSLFQLGCSTKKKQISQMGNLNASKARATADLTCSPHLGVHSQNNATNLSNRGPSGYGISISILSLWLNPKLSTWNWERMRSSLLLGVTRPLTSGAMHLNRHNHCHPWASNNKLLRQNKTKSSNSTHQKLLFARSHEATAHSRQSTGAQSRKVKGGRGQ